MGIDHLLCLTLNTNDHKSTVSKIVKETCKFYFALWKVLQPEYMPNLTSKQWVKLPMNTKCYGIFHIA